MQKLSLLGSDFNCV